jgi:predicted lactoylglutathione lyase
MKRIMDFGPSLWARARASGSRRQPYNKMPATVGNGVMIAFDVGETGKVDALYKKALELGGSDEGPPGDRGDNYYGAYFRDLDGNKINFHCWT